MYELNFKKNTNRYSELELFENIQSVWDYNQKQPTVNDLEKYPSKIHFGTYFNRFGSWKKALELFVVYKNNGELLLSKYDYKKKSRKTINNSLKYDVMSRDNFKCVLCGKSPAIDSNVLLEIDHINPVSNGGDNSIDNLRTLCKGCNIGKFNKL
jgi:hypothetical protein